MTKFWNLRNEGTSATLEIMGSIGDPKSYTDWSGDTLDAGGSGTLRDLAEQIKALGKPALLTVSISSEGGIAAVGLAVHNMLSGMAETRIIAQINGYCWSAATIIAMAADEVRMSANGSMMIHDVEVGYVSGDVAALAEVAKGMDALNRSIAAGYAGKAGEEHGTPDDWLGRMYAGLWMTGNEAKAIGLVDVVTDTVTITACGNALDFAANHNAPASMIAQIRAQVDDAARVNSEPSTDDMTAEEITTLVDVTTAKAIAEADARTAALIEGIKAEASTAAAAHAAEIAKLRAMQAHGIPSAAAGGEGVSRAQSAPDKPSASRKEFAGMTAKQREEFFRNGGSIQGSIRDSIQD